MDLIDRESLLQQCSDYCKANCKYTEAEQEVMCRACGTGDIIEFIEEASSQNQWIPCSERLPDKNGSYLVTGRQKAINKCRFQDGHWYGRWAIIAWQSLPEPYIEPKPNLKYADESAGDYAEGV